MYFTSGNRLFDMPFDMPFDMLFEMLFDMLFDMYLKCSAGKPGRALCRFNNLKWVDRWVGK